jgi:hypothetical protein
MSSSETVRKSLTLFEQRENFDLLRLSFRFLLLFKAKLFSDKFFVICSNILNISIYFAAARA